MIRCTNVATSEHHDLSSQEIERQRHEDAAEQSTQAGRRANRGERRRIARKRE